MPSPSATSSSSRASADPDAAGGAGDPTAVADTIVATATPPGRGAVAIVRASGPGVPAIAARVFRSARPLVPRLATFGRVIGPGGDAADEALALWFPAPASATGEDVLELQVHGSPAVVRETLAAVMAAGARLANPGEFTRRAFMAGKLDLAAAEAVGELIAAEHRSAARGALARLSGGLAAAVDAVAAGVAAVLEELAASTDYSDDVEPPARSDVARRLGEAAAELDALAADWERGRLVRDGAAVAIVGPPNAGKSSLLNALLGHDRAIVSPVPGTTRDTIEELVALGDGLVARAIDTAGMRAAADPLEAAGVARSAAALEAATLALVVIDGSVPAGEAERAVLAATAGAARVVFYNKADAGDRGWAARGRETGPALHGSALVPADVERVRAALATVLAGDGAPPDLARPHLGTARQADAVLAAGRSLALALATLAAGEPLDLLAGDLLDAVAALGELTGRTASEAVIDGIFARFCLGK